MTRLAIVGGDFGMQPIWNEDHTIALVCNGEIYNHQKLRIMLENMGHKFSTTSDVEVILHLYETFGDEFLSFLEGIFAFGLLEVNTNRILIARDRCGVKPLYYVDDERSFTFCSSFRALLNIQGTDLKIRNDGLAEYHAFRFCPFEDTLVDGIKKVSPGHCLIVEGNSLKKWAYWEPSQLMKQKTGNDVKTPALTLKDKLFAAVESQFAPDVKTGLLLSGGFDSTALLAIHRELNHSVPDTYTMSFLRPGGAANENEYSEMRVAQRVASHFGARHYHQEFTASDALEALPHIIRALDEPIADPTAIPLWFAVKMARQNNVRVLYSGEGLDEIQNGYEVYRQAHWLNFLGTVPEKWRQTFSQITRALGLPGQGILNRSVQPIYHWYHGVGGLFSEAEWRLLTQWSTADISDFTALRVKTKHLYQQVAEQSMLKQLTYFDVTTWLSENTLVKSDKISMAQSIELRVPFLNQGVVEYSLQLDDRKKLRNKTGKWLVKQALRDLVPDFVLNRKKAGFPVPLTAWMFGEWRPYVESVLLNPSACTRDFYRTESVESLFHISGKEQRRASRKLWALLCLELWLQHVYYPSRRASASDGESELGRRIETAVLV